MIPTKICSTIKDRKGVLIVSCTPGAKSAVNDCIVLFELGLFERKCADNRGGSRGISAGDYPQVEDIVP